MLEIVAVIFLTRHLSKTAKNKGHTGAYAAIGPLLWFGGEILGVVIGLAMFDDLLAAVGIGLVLAIAGAITSAVVVHSLPNKYLEDDFGEPVPPTPTGPGAAQIRENQWA